MFCMIINFAKFMYKKKKKNDDKIIPKDEVKTNKRLT